MLFQTALVAALAATVVAQTTPSSVAGLGNTAQEQTANNAIACEAQCVDPNTATQCHQACQTTIVNNINANVNGTNGKTSNTTATTTTPAATTTPTGSTSTNGLTNGAAATGAQASLLVLSAVVAVLAY